MVPIEIANQLIGDNRRVVCTLNKNYKISTKDTTSKNLDLLKLFEERKAIQLIEVALNSVKTAKKDLKITTLTVNNKIEL